MSEDTTSKRRLGPENPGAGALSLTKYINENYGHIVTVTPAQTQAYFTYHNEWQRARNVPGGEADQERAAREAAKAAELEATSAEREAAKLAKEAEKAAKEQEREAKRAEAEQAKAAKAAEREAKAAEREAEKATKAQEAEAKKAEREAERERKAAEAEAKRAEREAAKAAKADAGGADGDDSTSVTNGESVGRGALQEAKREMNRLKRKSPETVGVSESSF